jgi:hypothetical protein
MTVEIKKSNRTVFSKMGSNHYWFDPSTLEAYPVYPDGSLFHADENLLSLDEIYVIRTKAKHHSSKRMAKLVSALSSDARVDKDAVRKITDFITHNNSKMDPNALCDSVHSPERYSNYLGVYFLGCESSIWVKRRGYLGHIGPRTMVEVSNAVHRTLSQSTKFPSSHMGFTPNLTASDILVYLHELGHSIHYKSGCMGDFKGACEFLLDTAATLRDEWMLGLPECASDSYYVEGFAEFFVAYAAAGNKLKEIYPAVFAFIDKTLDWANRKSCAKYPQYRKYRSSIGRNSVCHKT